ncbi:type IV secretion system DotC family protein [Legionella jordanis]|uniref:Defect in organelle trafficking lipoprotein DotC n=1 Tax=Legionella jordanis TaxID=456 RepID=A0A0W0VBL8_9GAMM|nr:type IV secretion system DotC family protein [Legionella jordanis]KTD17514.1 defect in organelle trafficking lipoprotein DotC [Legionella jordanis]RMX05148.1 type IV secretion system protein DotC [Legionella jordanis]RMX17404.1 type IV secretion system protein DotC [Legionella jordanis]VEH13483.1 DotC [Legionella jordanis]HAT8714400.1 type IV secretion system protein DotC [Legionella jordanis]
MRKYIPSLCLCLIILLVGCHRTVIVPDTGSLAGLQAMANTSGSKSRSKANMGKIREMALKETALSLGAQAGLAWRTKIIDEHLNRQARNLDAIFDFNSLILEHNILPPVLLEGRNTFNLADTQTIRISDRTYKVAKQARFITTPPNWRQYLWLDYKKPDPPNVTLLPKTKQERALWCFYVEKGWKNGIEQAGVILEESIARIKEDFAGMILYRKLLAMNMVSPPFVSHTDLGVTGDSSEMHIDDRVLRITALPGLNINSKEWVAAVAKDEEALERFKNMEKLAQSTKISITSKAWQPVIAPINDKPLS